MSGCDRWSIDLARARTAFTLEAAGIERDARLSDLTAAEIDGILGAVVLAGAASPRLTADAAAARRIADAIQHEAQEEGADSPVDRGDAEQLANAAILALRQGRDPMIETDFQQRVRPWLRACFGDMIAGDREERNHRFLEEALELVQACGCTASEAHQLVDYVFSRPVGEPHQEVGGVMVTLAALCLAHDLDMHADGETELVRIWGKVEAIRAKQAAKPKHSPLPQAVSPSADLRERMERLVERMHARETDPGGALNIMPLFLEADAICAARDERPNATSHDELIDLADRVKALKSSDNAVDVLVEIALFTASPKAVSVRANAAGTKVIYTDADGNQTTHWPWDWTHQQLGKSNRRAHTAAALRARAADLLELKGETHVA